LPSKHKAQSSNPSTNHEFGKIIIVENLGDLGFGEGYLVTIPKT
jgi:hypothetical protein